MIERFLTKTELDKLKSEGKINYKQLSAWALERFELPYRENTEQFEVVLVNGTFVLPQDLFDPCECPVCGKKELRAYYLAASPTSGGHIIRTCCNACREYISIHDSEFYYKVKAYISAHRKEMNKLCDKD